MITISISATAAVLLAGLTLLGLFILAVLYKVLVTICADEIEGRLDRIAFWMLRMAARRLPEDLRQPLHDEVWLPELHFILKRDGEVPITRLWDSVRYAGAILLQVRQTARAAKPKPNLLERFRTVGGQVRKTTLRFGLTPGGVLRGVATGILAPTLIRVGNALQFPTHLVIGSVVILVLIAMGFECRAIFRRTQSDTHSK